MEEDDIDEGHALSPSVIDPMFELSGEIKASVRLQFKKIKER
jgi:hypothetical protein